MFKLIMISIMMATGSIGIAHDVMENGYVENVSIEVVEAATIELDVFYMYSDDNGTYWLEPEADNENVVWIGYDDLIEWNVDVDELHHGDRYAGVFDSEGWELFGLNEIE